MTVVENMEHMEHIRSNVACAKVMETGTVGVVVQSINDGYDADIIQVLDGTKENHGESWRIQIVIIIQIMPTVLCAS